MQTYRKIDPFHFGLSAVCSFKISVCVQFAAASLFFCTYHRHWLVLILIMLSAQHLGRKKKLLFNNGIFQATPSNTHTHAEARNEGERESELATHRLIVRSICWNWNCVGVCIRACVSSHSSNSLTCSTIFKLCLSICFMALI